MALLAGCTGGDGDGGDGDGGDSGDGGDTQEYLLNIGSSTEGSFTFAVAQALARAVDEHSDWLSVSAMESDGSSEVNLRLYDQGEFEAAGTDNLNLEWAYEDTGPFEEDPIDNVPYQGFFYLTAESYFVQPADAGLEDTSDMAGADVYAHSPGTSVRSLLELLLQTHGMWEDINPLGMSRGDLSGALEEGRIDALAVYSVNNAGLPGWLQELDAQHDFELVPMTDAFISSIEETPGLQHQVLDSPVGWENTDAMESVEDFSTYVSVSQFVLGPEVPAQAAHELARIASEHNDTVKEANSSYPDQSDPARQMAGLSPELPPVHEGVINYWQDQGVWEQASDELEVGEAESEL
jgi:TRAP transporter TAXI family solute receptor